MSTQTNPSAQEVLTALANSVVQDSIPDDKIPDFASAISEAQHRVTGIDICTVGICLDYRWDGALHNLKLEEFVDNRLGVIRSIEIFPEGIIVPEGVRLRINHSL